MAAQGCGCPSLEGPWAARAGGGAASLQDELKLDDH